jgi:hypothetical protein
VSIARIPLGFLLALALATLGCHFHSVGLPTDATAGEFIDLDSLDSGGTSEPKVVDAWGDSANDAGSKRGEAGETADLAPVPGDPVTIGCSDGTREGFRDFANWPGIAGCAGGWQVPGLLSFVARSPSCDRVAGNDSSNPNGDGCSAADLCADGWHACVDGPDVARSSPTGCESVGSPGDQAFFAVMTGASTQGVCYPDPSATNDLHGCGSIGQPESDGCPPLTRRMGFADCFQTGVWQCGTVDQSLTEAKWVTKSGPSLGGILCCRN